VNCYDASYYYFRYKKVCRPTIRATEATGIRPEELLLLPWEDIHTASREINLGVGVSKTRTSRFPELSENAVTWLEACRRGVVKWRVRLSEEFNKIME
jgi:site-specific recombinase XerD